MVVIRLYTDNLSWQLVVTANEDTHLGYVFDLLYITSAVSVVLLASLLWVGYSRVKGRPVPLVAFGSIAVIFAGLALLWQVTVLLVALRCSSDGRDAVGEAQHRHDD